jgi:hypothetical protein
MFTPKVFNWSFPYEYQISTELLKANENFTNLAKAFIEDDIEKQPIKRLVYVSNIPPENPTDGTLWFNTGSPLFTLNVYFNNNWLCIASKPYFLVLDDCSNNLQELEDGL